MLEAGEGDNCKGADETFGGSVQVTGICARCLIESDNVTTRNRFCSGYCRQEVEDAVKDAINDATDTRLLQLARMFKVRYKERK
ncbi:hypothetical protein ES703_114455 [subsurface metagenome]